MNFFINNLVLTKSSCPKRDVIVCTLAMFAFVSVEAQSPPLTK
jgi:hypothetical protein